MSKLNKLPKTISWKGKRVFGVPLRIYQQTTGHLLPIGIVNALEYILQHAGKCDGLFRKPGVKSKIDQLRSEIERIDYSLESIPFDQYPPYVIADVIRQYFRELSECLIPPSLTRLLADLLQSITPEEQLLAVRYTFLILPDETREVLQILLRFLFNVSIRLGNNQVGEGEIHGLVFQSLGFDLDDVSKFSTNISSISLSIVLYCTTNFIENLLVEMEEREIQWHATGK